jgi:hypothetical protein
VRIAATRTENPTVPDRSVWRAQRAAMEARDEKHTPFGPRHRRWGQFKRLLVAFRILLKTTRLFEAGLRRALDLRLVELTLSHPDLPPEFDGYRLLHLTDLHLDGMPNLNAVIAGLVRDRPVDLAVWTGDYRWRVHGAHEQVLPGIAEIVRAISASDGQYATLGNHDPVAMVDGLEALGLSVPRPSAARCAASTETRGIGCV